MADNFLEKRYAELQSGKPAIRRSTPSLDTLLKKAATPQESAPDYTVKQAQLDAIVRSMSLLGHPFSFETSETRPGAAAFIKVVPDGTDGFEAGELLLVAALKAAELGLSCRMDRSSLKMEFFR